MVIIKSICHSSNSWVRAVIVSVKLYGHKTLSDKNRIISEIVYENCVNKVNCVESFEPPTGANESKREREIRSAYDIITYKAPSQDRASHIKRNKVSTRYTIYTRFYGIIMYITNNNRIKPEQRQVIFIGWTRVSERE